MKLRIVLTSLALAVFAVASNAQSLQTPNAPGLLATTQARTFLDQDPSVTTARAGLEVARQEASILSQSPYEWTAKGMTQRRNVTAVGRYNEWNVGIERGMRLPAKGAADRRLGEATLDEARARYGEAVHNSARELMASWLDWLAAEQAYALAQASLVPGPSWPNNVGLKTTPKRRLQRHGPGCRHAFRVFPKTGLRCRCLSRWIKTTVSGSSGFCLKVTS
jgi:cobalt-zinc-cadmium efflux system outer membrane protein